MIRGNGCAKAPTPHHGATICSVVVAEGMAEMFYVSGPDNALQPHRHRSPNRPVGDWPSKTKIEYETPLRPPPADRPPSRISPPLLPGIVPVIRSDHRAQRSHPPARLCPTTSRDHAQSRKKRPDRRPTRTCLTPAHAGAALLHAGQGRPRPNHSHDRESCLVFGCFAHKIQAQPAILLSCFLAGMLPDGGISRPGGRWPARCLPRGSH